MKDEKRAIRIFFSLVSLLCGALAWKWRPSFASTMVTAAGLVLFGVSVLRPLALRPLFHAWQRFGHALGRFNTQVLLLLVYLLVFVPAGLLLKMAGKDLLARKRTKDGSYWRSYEAIGIANKDHYERQF